MNETAADIQKTFNPTINENEPMLAKKRALVVEDDPFSRHLFTKILSENFSRLETISCRDFQTASDLLERNFFDLLILDIFLGNEKNGVDLYYKSQTLDPAPMVIMTSALSTEDYTKLFYMKGSVPPYLPKPFQITNCVDLIGALIEEKLQ